MSELAIVSARTSKLRAAGKGGSVSARVAVQLAADPGKFLSTVQIGITLVGIVAGAYSGRSEEHTSELQSLMRISYAVFCLKKKKAKRNKVHLIYNNLTESHE